MPTTDRQSCWCVHEKQQRVACFYFVDTHVARIRADWTAIGQTRDEDDWDVA